jgi:hypothetical protein
LRLCLVKVATEPRQGHVWVEPENEFFAKKIDIKTTGED